MALSYQWHMEGPGPVWILCLGKAITASAENPLISTSDKYLQSLIQCEEKFLSLLHPLTNLIPCLCALDLKTGCSPG